MYNIYSTTAGLPRFPTGSPGHRGPPRWCPRRQPQQRAKHSMAPATGGFTVHRSPNQDIPSGKLT